MTDELWRRGARQLAADIAAKRITSREVVEAHLARIAAVNPAVNAVVKVLADDARRMADEADRAVSHGRVVEVMDRLRQIPNLQLALENSKAQ